MDRTQNKLIIGLMTSFTGPRCGGVAVSCVDLMGDSTLLQAYFKAGCYLCVEQLSLSILSLEIMPFSELEFYEPDDCHV